MSTLVKLAGTAAAVALPLVGLLGGSTAGASTVYRLSTSYGSASFDNGSDRLCASDTNADGNAVKVVLSWYSSSTYHTRTVKALSGSGSTTCNYVDVDSGQQMSMTLSRNSGSGAVSRTVYG